MGAPAVAADLLVQKKQFIIPLFTTCWTFDGWKMPKSFYFCQFSQVQHSKLGGPPCYFSVPNKRTGWNKRTYWEDISLKFVNNSTGLNKRTLGIFSCSDMRYLWKTSFLHCLQFFSKILIIALCLLNAYWEDFFSL